MLTRFANPARFMRLSGAVQLPLGITTVAALAVGLYLALFVAPPDYFQGETVRIMFVHVPAAWLALQTYLFVAVASAVALVWKHPLAEIAAQAAAPLGAAFALVCLVTGSLWGRPMWGTWWVWDLRLTSMLILFFLYLGYIALADAFDDATRGARAASVLAIVGVVMLPIIKFSVEKWWWRVFDFGDAGDVGMPKTLHQPASIGLGGSSISAALLVPLLVMSAAFTLLFVWLLLVRMRTALNERRARALLLAAPQRRAGSAPSDASAVLR